MSTTAHCSYTFFSVASAAFPHGDKTSRRTPAAHGSPASRYIVSDLLLQPFYSGAFSLHFISSHPLPLSLPRHNPRQPYILITEKNTYFNRPIFQSINCFGK
jgi:hypothetical protein